MIAEEVLGIVSFDFVTISYSSSGHGDEYRRRMNDGMFANCQLETCESAGAQGNRKVGQVHNQLLANQPNHVITFQSQPFQAAALFHNHPRMRPAK